MTLAVNAASLVSWKFLLNDPNGTSVSNIKHKSECLLDYTRQAMVLSNHRMQAQGRCYANQHRDPPRVGYWEAVTWKTLTIVLSDNALA